MKSVAVQGSPHRGNTYERVERFGDALARQSEVDFEHVPLNEMKLEPCRGCFRCFVRGEDACPIDRNTAERR